MKANTLIFSILLAFALASAALAQQGPAKPPQTPSTSAAQTAPKGPLTKGKVAVMNTDVLQEQIVEFRTRLEALNRQFEPQVKELQGLGERINALETTIQTQRDILGATKIAELSEQLDRMKRDYQRKKEDLEAQGSRQKEVALRPLNEKLSKFAADYTARKGILILFDLGNALESNTLVWFDSRLDVTQDFINEYNKANPVTPAPPK
jgi:Skp family chaperone for outer membrane proteins